ncbi:hypothetical protein CVIRNUC_009754 [Coccomyxa viridis]|uniref:Uncharacterized protein n=1 Tax=Coccomyxa viridis TaxID=1274662 RepID=A0AAV1IGT4_9CHLO|nr:hypothetical protein CVIRNUC_009754 [Coccomyxa viridis]
MSASYVKVLRQVKHVPVFAGTHRIKGRSQQANICMLQGSSGGSLGSSIDIANRGQIRFYRKSATTCTVKLTISYEVPPVLAPVAGALTPIVESILSTDLKRFANLAAQEPLQA